MGQLKACIDCGHQISSEAGHCPNCHSRFPHGVSCLACRDAGGAAVSVKKAHSHPHISRSDLGTPHYYHVECVQRLMAVPDTLTCPDCGASLSSLWKWEELCEAINTDCKKCAAPDVFDGKPYVWHSRGFCCKCHLPIFKFHRREEWGEGYYHDSCLRILQAKERARADREAQEEKLKKTGAGCMVMATIAFAILVLIILR
jgi:hypothetical protein